MLDDRGTTNMPPHLTRDDSVRAEGTEAARRGLTAKDNPYRSGSADGLAWRQGFDRSIAGKVLVEG